MLWKVKECYEIILGRHNQGRTERGGKQGKVFRHPLPPPPPPPPQKKKIALNIPPTNKTIEVAFCGE